MSKEQLMLNLDSAPVAQSILGSAHSFKTFSRPPHKDRSKIVNSKRRTMAAQAEKKTLPEKNARSRGRVLLVTDEPQPVLVDCFAEKGIEVVGVSTGTAAIVSLQRARPHLVVANPSATGLSVNELARMLDQSDNGIPLVLAGAATSNHATRLAALTDGAFDYFQMPQEIDLLLRRSEQLITLRQKIEKLRSDADLDALTGLANRRRFRVALIREVERWRRYNVPCALLLLDIDHLKDINDKFGHPAGDSVIRHVARILAEVSRDNDVAARLGGEEFALLLSGIEVEKAGLAAERLREVICRRPVEGVGVVSVSIGVAGCPSSATLERTLYEASDQALYVAKNGGRNRVSVAPLLQEKLPGV